jgi:fructose-1,6-bisphosphatase/inositol monophosphatase family enzyme
MTQSELLLSHLESLYRAIVQAVTDGNAAEWGTLGQNAKGDQVKWFDLAADRAVCNYLEHHFPCPVELLSEEGEPRQFGRGEPEWTMILDPVDGSENFSRGLTPAGMAIALVPASQPVAVETVELALVGDLYRGQVWQAVRGRGAWRDGQSLRPSRVTQLEQAIINCDISGAAIQPALAEVLAEARSIRSFGAATLVLVHVADGALEAHVDVRDRLTPENYLAPGLIIQEAGGLITDPQGAALPPIQSLTESYSVIAAANQELHAVLRQRLSAVS